MNEDACGAVWRKSEFGIGFRQPAVMLAGMNDKRGARRPWRVQLVMERDQEYFRDVVLGARRRAFEGGALEFIDRWLPHELAEDLGALVRRDGVRGIVAAIHDPQREAEFLALGVPVVNVSNSVLASRLPVVTQDDRAVGRLAAEHLLGRGLRRFLFWGQPGARYSEERRAGFMAALAAAGVERGAVAEGGSVFEEAAERAEFGRMRAALRGLPRPAGVFAVLDRFALSLLRAGREEGLDAPEGLAVLGAGDDDFFVEFERTPLSSIRLPSRQIGYEAAALLERLIAGGGAAWRGEPERVELAGARVVARRSTEAVATADPLVARAAALMRARPAAKVGEIARACGVARSGLQRRFLAALGRGMLAELQRVRLERAEALLAASDAKLSAVAAEAGFPGAQRLAALMRRAHGCTPGEWRERARRR